MLLNLFGLILILLLCSPTSSIYNIEDYGAVRATDTHGAQIANQQAFLIAIQLANSTTTGERAIKVPKGTFYFLPVVMKYVYNVSIIIQGRMAATKLLKYWPVKQNKRDFQDFISCSDCQYLTISGGGKIDGRGYQWWLIWILNAQKKRLPYQGSRPHLINLLNNRNIKIHDLIMKNSACFHLRMQNCYDAEIYNLNIRVNTTAQINLLKKLSFSGIIPLFPLNTDGIDPSGARMHIYNITVQNFDDVVVPKPSHEGSYGGNCTQDMLIQNATVKLGVGMSIGSVPPNEGCNCIRNITFRNVYMQKPFKAIYVKTNPGDKGSGLIQNILYQNFTINEPVWWAIYIGPQQMKEPDGGGPGCMLYPFDKHGTCGTQPLVTIKNISLENIRIHNSLLYPVTIRCNKTNPCQQINIKNVKTDKWFIGQKNKGYVCEYASVNGQGNQPTIQCLKQSNQQSSLRKVSEKIEKQPQLSYQDYQQVLKQMEKAALEIGYQEQDDQFNYELDPTQYFKFFQTTVQVI